MIPNVSKVLFRRKSELKRLKIDDSTKPVLFIRTEHALYHLEL
jgi:hypothetical protein